ncbi:hypothetical protein B0H19DRAFT_1379969 [Mycena capillaripes]|nr:hypothetical protein B0H19DRAFT_1379969 [Mycena capillaripes]
MDKYPGYAILLPTPAPPTVARAHSIHPSASHYVIPSPTIPHSVRAVPTAPLPSVNSLLPYYTPSFRFPEEWLYENVQPPPSQWPEHIRDYVYGPASPEPSSWADDVTEPAAAPTAIMTIAPALRWPALHSLGGHPWRAIRRRKRRLRADCSWQQPPFEPHFDTPPAAPPSSPPRPLIPENWVHGRSLQPAELLGLQSLHCDTSIHPDNVPLLDIPAPSLCLCPADHLPPPPAPAPSFPAETSYGSVQSSLALAYATASEKGCFAAITDVVSLVWGSSGTYLEKGLLARLPGDQLIFLCMLADFVALEPVFTTFLHPAITDFATGWIEHCQREDAGGEVNGTGSRHVPRFAWTFFGGG